MVAEQIKQVDCAVCRGMGRQYHPTPPSTICPQCGGTGKVWISMRSVSEIPLFSKEEAMGILKTLAGLCIKKMEHIVWDENIIKMECLVTEETSFDFMGDPLFFKKLWLSLREQEDTETSDGRMKRLMKEKQEKSEWGGGGSEKIPSVLKITEFHPRRKVTLPPHVPPEEYEKHPVTEEDLDEMGSMTEEEDLSAPTLEEMTLGVEEEIQKVVASAFKKEEDSSKKKSQSKGLVEQVGERYKLQCARCQQVVFINYDPTSRIRPERFIVTRHNWSIWRGRENTLHVLCTKCKKHAHHYV